MMQDMTKGSPARIILAFAAPMLVSMAFQQMYNIADSVIVGNFVNIDALAAVSASYPITVLFLAVATGASTGCSVVISQLFAQKDFERMKSAISTAVLSILAIAVALTISGAFFCDPLLRLIATPENVFAESSLYLRIYIFGLAFLFLYNATTAIYNGLGDSRTPLFFLIFSSVLNVALDLFFVVSLHMGVGGVAWATFIAQGISAVASAIVLFFRLRRIESPPYARFSGALLGKMTRVAVPSILQQSCVSVGQLFVQGLINSFGSDYVAAYGAAFKVSIFAVTIINTMSTALSSFMAQNFGAGQIERMKRGWRVGVAISEIMAGVLIALLLLFGRELVALFMDASANTQVVEIGYSFLVVAAPFYAVLALKTVSDSVLRGAACMVAFMVTTFSDLLLRVVMSYVLAPGMGFAGICWSYPIGWVVGAAAALLYYFSGRWKRHRLAA